MSKIRKLQEQYNYLKLAKDIKKDYIYSIICSPGMVYNWHSISICTKITEKSFAFFDLMAYPINKFEDDYIWEDTGMDICNHDNFIVYEIGHKDKFPEYFL